MKRIGRLLGLLTTVFALLFGVSLAQDSAKQDMKDAGHETKQAAQDAGQATKKPPRRPVTLSRREPQGSAQNRTRRTKVEDKTKPE